MSINIDHLALWAQDLDKTKAFYIKYFDILSGEKYHNPTKQFTSYFHSFRNSPVRLELMHRPDILDPATKKGLAPGLAHMAISVGSKEAVNALTEKLRADGYNIEGEPRTTGDGYYESVVLDPEGNLIEITV